MGKYFVSLLGLVLMFAHPSRADITITNGSADDFAAAISTTIVAGGGTIVVTTPIVIGSTNGPDDEVVFDGLSRVTVSGANKSPIFTVDSGHLTLANMAVVNGFDTISGAAMYIATNAAAVLTNCTFSGNVVHGLDGVSADSNTNSTGTPVFGKNGGRGTSGNTAYGGAVFNVGDLAIFNCKFITNSAIGGTGGDGANGQDGSTRGGSGGSGGAGGSAIGGGVFNYGTLVVSNCTFSGNVARGGSGGIGGSGGGGIIAGANGFSGATGIGAGAGIYTADTNTALILNSTFDHNTAQGGDGQEGGTSSSGFGQNGPRGGDALGGGVENSGSLFVMNSTFFQNNALGGAGGNGGGGSARGGSGGAGGSAIGGGIYNSSYVMVINSTFSKGNAVGGTNGTAGGGLVSGKNGRRGSSFGGNIANIAKKKSGSFQLFNSIIASALSGGGGYGTISNGGYNISADKSIKFKKGGTSMMNTNPLVGDLGDNGGPTQTIPLQTNSPAIDKIPSTNAPAIDQRGFERPIPLGGASDIGAYELDTERVTIIIPPKSTNVIVGSSATFTVTAGGTGPFVYQWFFNGAPVSGATTNLLLITNAQTTNSGNYLVVVSNNFNAVTSSVAVLTVTNFVNSRPTLTGPTNRQDVVAGTTVVISVSAISATPVYYQWSFTDSATLNTVDLAGANSNVLTIANAQTTNSGFYQVVATNSSGSVTSGVSRLVVTNAPGNINPGEFLQIKRVPAPAIQMTSSPGTSRNCGVTVGVDVEGAAEESLCGRAFRQGELRVEVATSTRDLLPIQQRARSGALYQARLERQTDLFRVFLPEVS